MRNLFRLVRGKQTQYDYSCVLVKLPPDICEFLERFNKEVISEDCLHEKGRETEYHITLLYGIEDEKSTEALQLLRDTLNTSEFKIKLGVVSKFYQDDYDVIKIDVDDYTGKLEAAFNTLSENLDNENTYEDYHPHITLAYVTKGACEHLVGDETFYGLKVEIDNVKFSSSNPSHSDFVTFGKKVTRGGGTFYKVYLRHEEDCVDNLGREFANKLPNGYFHGCSEDDYGSYFSLSCYLPTDLQVLHHLEGDTKISEGKVAFVLKDNFEVPHSRYILSKKNFRTLARLKRGSKLVDFSNVKKPWTFHREDKNGNVILDVIPDDPSILEGDDNVYDRFRNVIVQDTIFSNGDLIMEGETTINTITPIVKFLIERNWKLEDAIIAAASTCEDCLNILLEESEGNSYPPEQWAGTSCEYCKILKK